MRKTVPHAREVDSLDLAAAFAAGAVRSAIEERSIHVLFESARPRHNPVAGYQSRFMALHAYTVRRDQRARPLHNDRMVVAAPMSKRLTEYADCAGCASKLDAVLLEQLTLGLPHSD